MRLTIAMGVSFLLGIIAATYIGPSRISPDQRVALCRAMTSNLESTELTNSNIHDMLPLFDASIPAVAQVMDANQTAIGAAEKARIDVERVCK